jgi:hypothetical protein
MFVPFLKNAGALSRCAHRHESLKCRSTVARAEIGRRERQADLADCAREELVIVRQYFEFWGQYGNLSCCGLHRN